MNWGPAPLHPVTAAAATTTTTVRLCWDYICPTHHRSFPNCFLEPDLLPELRDQRGSYTCRMLGTSW